MSEAPIVLGALFALGMMAVGAVLFVKGAREQPKTPSSWPQWPPTRLS